GAAVAVGHLDPEVVPAVGLELDRQGGLAAARAAVDVGRAVAVPLDQPHRAARADVLGEGGVDLHAGGHVSPGVVHGAAEGKGVAGVRDEAAGVGAPADGHEVVAGLPDDLQHLPALAQRIVGDLGAIGWQVGGRAGDAGHAVLEVLGVGDGPLGDGALPQPARTAAVAE